MIKKYRFLFFAAFFLFSCSKEQKHTGENIKNITMERIMKYNFKEAINTYEVPKLAIKYDNIEKGDNIEGFPESISKFIQPGKKIKILDAVWIDKTKNTEIQVWYTQDEKGLWIPFNAEQRKISKYFLENQ